MRRDSLTILLVSLLLLAGCGGPTPAQKSEKPAPPAYLEAAGQFVVALRLADAPALSELIPSDAVAKYGSELGTIQGASIDTVKVARSWDGSILSLGFDGNDLKLRSDSTTSVVVSDGQGSMTLSLAEVGSRWIVTSVNDEPSVCKVLALSPAGAVCRASMDAIVAADMMAEFSGDDFDTVSQLAPKYLDPIPACPSNGEYRLDPYKFIVCSVHGLR